MADLNRWRRLSDVVADQAGNRFALAAVPETQTAAKQDKLVFIFDFFEELRRLAPVSTR